MPSLYYWLSVKCLPGAGCTSKVLYDVKLPFYLDDLLWTTTTVEMPTKGRQARSCGCMSSLT
uniref:Uncharacterized protein n=1 Tax=Oryza brachyantha TaxID=4533 RepID=J3M535_ORYBR